MAERFQSTTPFKEGQQTNAHGKDAPKTPVKYKMARERNIGQPDPLKQALTAPPREFSDTQHFLKRPVQPKGHAYKPDGEFGRPTGKMMSKATGMTSNTSRPGENPLGSNSNRKGDNPLGHAMNKVGVNALGKNSNHRGDNPLGHNSNRTGEKSGYGHFRPSAGGKKP